jgi:hypothetical protein
MKTHRTITVALLAAALLSFGMVGNGQAGDTRADVVGEADIQAQLDRRVDNEASDRQAVQDLLRRPEVRKIAGAAGLDIERASAAAGVLSGAELKDVAARAHQINDVVGGRQTVTIAVTTLIIIVLIIIILS